ncbi:MAG TPA: DNA-3-methyladenine glycosylase [Bacteroidales bacterium]|jgi:DNA-3-methyladenine glycosylase|nr:DNA-3-methyladenine glycosylase [Bacteroidales bacterium]MDD4234443.1 DNA-3-methyladenine glycosylase [Bacteroidales bacterium]MDY0160299.1 DNA-3-methyladenine glycosylase [Bacteroidales bacterium]HXK80605.1 DNA-3-methyladenine glycosylase [Bacteroidales bacterium]
MELDRDFFIQDAATLAKKLLACKIVRDFGNGIIKSYAITETEAYLGEQDKACHASKGRTKRTEVMYLEGGHIYMYLIYGMYWMFNIVSGELNLPQAVLIRGIECADGPGKLTRLLKMDKTFNAEHILYSSRIKILGAEKKAEYISAPRVGIDYAGTYWAKRKLRYILVR